ncbi:flavodoxin family protein [uncultured Pelagimonas sp.]|uniref:flavodoxin family protein n=1 Tax=uncultured Pelagimonas sp. TaxID=1618102 RepID=UPI00263448E6|nr:flavodoxin family protein [uncultured Pelagimonas sp.]
MTQADIPLICIPYFSADGHTAALARLISEGAGGARLVDVTAMEDADWDALDAATLIAMGTPTYMGSSAARFDMFIEEAAERWQHQAWGDKMAAGFTVAVHPSGDKLTALMRLTVFAAQMGMIWVGQNTIGAPVFPEAVGLNRDGSWLGLMATGDGDSETPISAADAQTARLFGARLAAAASRWHTGAE